LRSNKFREFKEMSIKKKIIKYAAIACIISTAVNAEEAKPINKADYNFAILRIGIDQPIASGGIANIDNSEATYTAGFEVGKKFKDIFAVGLEYKKVGNSNMSVNNITRAGGDTYTANWQGKSDMFMLNFSTDFIKNSAITPYIKFGLGTSINASSDYVVTKKSSRDGFTDGKEVYLGKSVVQFAWQIGLGINVTSNELFDIDMAYMFLDRGQMTTAGGYAGTGVGTPSDSGSLARTTNLHDHSVTVGLKAKF
jgi:outer membrane protein W